MVDKLRESKYEIADIIDFLPDATFVIDSQGIVISWNRMMEEMTGISKVEMVGQGDYAYSIPFYGDRRKLLLDLTDLDDEKLQSRYKNITRKGNTLYEEVFTPALYEGKGAYVWATGSPLFDLLGNRIGAIESIREISEWKQVEEALKKSKEKYRTVADFTYDWEFWIAQDGNYYYVSPSCESITGYRSREFILNPDLLIKITHSDDQDKIIDYLSFIQERHTEHGTLEFRIITKDGQERWIGHKSQPVYNTNGDYQGIRGSNRDITERKQMEEALRQANKKLTLLSGITRHDINNHLRSINWFLELLHQKSSDPTLEDYFTRITKASSRISSIIRFTKEYEDIGINYPTWHDCRTLVDTAVKKVMLGKVIVKNLIPVDSEVFADPLIIKVFYNLIDNALEYGGKIKTIQFFVEDCEGNHIFICEDDGDGVPADEKEKIFDPGYGKNTGLGLALSREILILTDITIRETGEPGKGARFEMTVPGNMWHYLNKGS